MKRNWKCRLTDIVLSTSLWCVVVIDDSSWSSSVLRRVVAFGGGKSRIMNDSRMPLSVVVNTNSFYDGTYEDSQIGESLDIFSNTKHNTGFVANCQPSDIHPVFARIIKVE